VSLEVREGILNQLGFQAAFFAAELGGDAAAIGSDLKTSWGEAYYYDAFFRRYDAVIVYSKRGPKKMLNCVQRLANAMRSGVLCGIPTDSSYLHLECIGTNFWVFFSPVVVDSSRPRGARTDGPRIVGNEGQSDGGREF
jgi:hypothetical protein